LVSQWARIGVSFGAALVASEAGLGRRQFGEIPRAEISLTQDAGTLFLD
jgi:hypothetical protein